MSDSPSRPSAERLPAIDALRAIGASWVVMAHVSFITGFGTLASWRGLTARGDVGVAIFFVLSGFLLFRPFAYASATGGRRPDVRRYLWRRAVRILPAYWLLTAAVLVLLRDNGVAASDWW